MIEKPADFDNWMSEEWDRNKKEMRPKEFKQWANEVLFLREKIWPKIAWIRTAGDRKFTTYTRIIKRHGMNP